MILAWSDLLGELPPATKAAAQEAQPLSVDDNVITFGVSPGQLPNAKSRFKKEADTIRDALSSQARSPDAVPPRRPRRASSPNLSAPVPALAPPPDDAPPDDDVIDLTELVDADGNGAAVDSVSVIAQRLDATVVEERPRD